MDTVKVNELKRIADVLRRAASDLRPFSASVSTRVDANAAELEIRASNIERGITP